MSYWRAPRRYVDLTDPDLTPAEIEPSTPEELARFDDPRAQQRTEEQHQRVAAALEAGREQWAQGSIGSEACEHHHPNPSETCPACGT